MSLTFLAALLVLTSPEDSLIQRSLSDGSALQLTRVSTPEVSPDGTAWVKDIFVINHVVDGKVRRTCWRLQQWRPVKSPFPTFPTEETRVLDFASDGKQLAVLFIAGHEAKVQSLVLGNEKSLQTVSLQRLGSLVQVNTGRVMLSEGKSIVALEVDRSFSNLIVFRVEGNEATRILDVPVRDRTPEASKKE